ncbi:hypothetical protein PMAYCL1PPCAC_30067, partial [Pristionchus mayeri]
FFSPHRTHAQSVYNIASYGQTMEHGRCVEYSCERALLLLVRVDVRRTSYLEHSEDSSWLEHAVDLFET